MSQNLNDILNRYVKLMPFEASDSMRILETEIPFEDCYDPLYITDELLSNEIPAFLFKSKEKGNLFCSPFYFPVLYKIDSGIDCIFPNKIQGIAKLNRGEWIGYSAIKKEVIIGFLYEICKKQGSFAEGTYLRSLISSLERHISNLRPIDFSFNPDYIGSFVADDSFEHPRYPLLLSEEYLKEIFSYKEEADIIIEYRHKEYPDIGYRLIPTYEYIYARIDQIEIYRILKIDQNDMISIFKETQKDSLGRCAVGLDDYKFIKDYLYKLE